jgi:beta-mannosidase
VDLTGTWRAAPADETARRSFHEPEYDDSAWNMLAVPGHWAADPAFGDCESVLHRCRFETPEIAENPQRRWWLQFDGITQQGDVWLDGVYLGDTEGYFVPHAFEVTDLLAERAEHIVAVDVTCRRFGDPDNRSSLTGALQDPELCGSASMIPGGIWRPVSLRATAPTAIRHFRAVCLDANPARARLAMRTVFDTPAAGSVVLRTRVAGTDHELVHPSAAGENRVEWTVEVPAPDLWWPHRLGNQPLHELRLDVVVDGEVHDTRHVSIGFRSVRMHDWALIVNGERLFIKGTSVLPTRPLLGDASGPEIAADVTAARDAGLDLIRPIAHIARPELYEAADRCGMLIWQDLPIRGVMSRGVRDQARRQAREAVDLLGHHPSVALWCAHDEPFARPVTPSATPGLIGQQRPSWNRAVLDRALRRVLERTDGSRPVINHTAVPPHLPTLDGTTSHLWFGWHGGRAADIAQALSRVPRMGRFVSAFGAASVNPDSVGTSWSEMDWEALGERCSADWRALQRLVPIEDGRDIRSWATLTQLAQADVVKTTIELLRRLKYSPTGGFIHHTLADPGSDGGFGVLAHDRRPKPAWRSLVEACRPVIVVADPMPPELHAGQQLRLAVHVVSDLRHELSDAVIEARLTGADGVELSTRRWAGTIAADSCQLIGHVELVAPSRPGPITLVIELSAAAREITNSYETRVS